MGETTVLDKTFHFIMKRMVETGQALFYTEIAAELGSTGFIWMRLWVSLWSRLKEMRSLELVAL